VSPVEVQPPTTTVTVAFSGWTGLFAILAALGACADGNGPRLESATPSATGRGGLVTIAGERLCGGDCETAAGAIRIGLDTPVQANIIDYTDTAAQIRIPDIAPVGKTVIVATVNEHASNTLDFEVLP